VAPVATPTVLPPVSVPEVPCDMKVKLECVRTKAALETDCNALSHCSTATDEAIEEIVKGERCWTDGRK